jgi:hypothetical protein
LITILDTFQFETGHKEKKAIAMNKKSRPYTGEEKKAIFEQKKLRNTGIRQKIYTVK